MSFWQGTRVLVTGHTGFKGGWISLMLERAGAKVTGFSLPPETSPNFFTAAAVAEGIDSHFGDIRFPDTIQQVMKTARPDVVFHLAAQALVRRSYEDPVGTYTTNVLGTVHVLEAARTNGSVRAVVNVTSDKCYENRESIWGYREYDPMGGNDPYSSSKGCAELVANAYRKSFLGNQKLVCVRAGNVVGGGDWSPDRLVPDCIRAFSRGEEVLLRYPRSLRPWQHVLEPLSGYMTVAERMLSGTPTEPAYNFGPPVEQTYSVEEVVSCIARCWGNGASWAAATRPAPAESKLLVLDSALARASLDWRPKLGLEECMVWIVEWYKRQQAGDDMRAFSFRQIEHYQSL